MYIFTITKGYKTPIIKFIMSLIDHLRAVTRCEQRSWFITVKHLKYKERLIRLQLPTLRYRRTIGDTIEVYKKILTNKYDNNIKFSFETQQNSRTRGHS